MSIHCPYCMTRMKPYVDLSDKRKLWSCINCESVFHIIEMGWHEKTERGEA